MDKDRKDMGNHAQLLCGAFPVYHKIEEATPEKETPIMTINR
jgi:hypothetical protein